MFDFEPTTTDHDDLLLLPFEHGFLLSDPIRNLDETHVGEDWSKDSYESDFSGPPLTEIAYPGEISMQFFAYYDVESPAAEDLEAWATVSGKKHHWLWKAIEPKAWWSRFVFGHSCQEVY